MSSALVESFASDFTPDEFTDEYQEELRALIEAKLKKGDAVDTEETFGEKEEGEEEEGGEVLDLMEALKRSVERSREAKKSAPTEKKPVRKAKSSA
jgi:DNA end-binding protein Ku